MLNNRGYASVSNCIKRSIVFKPVVRSLYLHNHIAIGRTIELKVDQLTLIKSPGAYVKFMINNDSAVNTKLSALKQLYTYSSSYNININSKTTKQKEFI